MASAVLAPYANARQSSDQQVISRIARIYFRAGELDEVVARLGKSENQLQFSYAEFVQLGGTLYGTSNPTLVRIQAFYKYALTLDRTIQHMRVLDSYISSLNQLNTKEAADFIAEQLPDPNTADPLKLVTFNPKFALLRSLAALDNGHYLSDPMDKNANVTLQGSWDSSNDVELRNAFRRSTARISLFNMFIKLMKRYQAASKRSVVFMSDDIANASNAGPFMNNPINCAPGMMPRFVDSQDRPVPADLAIIKRNGKEYVNTGLVDINKSGCQPMISLDARRRRRRTSARKPATGVRRRRRTTRLPSLGQLMSARSRYRRPVVRRRRPRRTTYRSMLGMNSAMTVNNPLSTFPSQLPFSASARRRRRPAIRRRPRSMRAMLVTPSITMAARRRRRRSSLLHRRRRPSMLATLAARRRRRSTLLRRRRVPRGYGASSILRAMSITPAVSMAARRRRRPTVHRRRRPTMYATMAATLAARRRRYAMRALTVNTPMMAARRRYRPKY